MSRKSVNFIVAIVMAVVFMWIMIELQDCYGSDPDAEQTKGRTAADQVEEGMTAEQVRSALGPPTLVYAETEAASTAPPGVEVEYWQYAGSSPRDPTVTLTMTDGVVTEVSVQR